MTIKWHREGDEWVAEDGAREAAVWKCDSGSKNHKPWAWAVYETKSGTTRKLASGFCWRRYDAKSASAIEMQRGM